jgi:hypothetical protein
MISINKTQPKITKIRYTCLKEFDIDVTINNETHNLGIVVKSEEDKQGQDTDLVAIRVENKSFGVCQGQDVGEKLSGHLGSWFDEKYPQCPVEDSKEDFDAIFEAVWEYLVAKDIY